MRCSVFQVKEESAKPQRQLVEEKQQQSSPDINENVQTDTDNDPIAVLKLRYAKGEITKEEYVEMCRTIES